MSVTDPLDRVTSYLYTDRGQLRQITGPDPGTGVGEDPAVITIGYDPAGNQTSVTDPLLRTTTTVYDAQNRVKEVQLPAIVAGTPKTIYGYDLAGQLTSISDAVNTTSYVYDNAGRVKQVNHPVGGATQYEYNKNDELTRLIDRNERKRDFTYNDLGLPLTEKWLTSIDSLVRTITWTYDDAGRLITAQDPDSKYAYTYNIADEVTSVDNLGTPGGMPNVVLNYAYDFAGNRTSLTDNLDHSIIYSYADHRLDTMSLMAGAATVATVDFGYDSIGRLTAINRLAGIEAPIKTAFTYDDADRLKQIKHTHETQTPTTLSQFDYTFDVASQLKTLNASGTSLWTEALTYGYDNTGQLTSVTGTRNGNSVNESYTFDINGNRTMTGYTSDPTDRNRMTSDGVYNYTYDSEGNTLTKTKISNNEETTYTWDHRNRLTQVVVRSSPGGSIIKQANYTYDVDDRRIGVLEDADGSGPGLAQRRWTVYDGDNPYADFDAAGGLTKRYLYGPAMDQVFARSGANEDVDWYLTDILGSVRQIADTNGTVLNAVTYDSFGKILSETNPSNGDRFKFTARELDALFSQYYYRARYYSADTGRFISADPIGFAGGDTNLYRYVGNAPTNLTDPLGLAQQPPPGSRGLIEFQPRRTQDMPTQLDPSVTVGVAGAMAVGVIRELPLTLGRNAITLIWEISPGKFVSWAARAIRAGYRFAQVGSRWVVQRFANGRWVTLSQREASAFSAQFLPWTTGTPLTRACKDALRRDAREIWQAARRALPAGAQVHHRIPLEWAHLFRDLDPNRVSNLYSVANQAAHTPITNAWNAWRQALNGRIPTPDEILAQARRIDEQFGHLMTRAIP